jgi:phage terminase large subunit-like protein
MIHADPTTFIEEQLVDPETGAPFHLLPAERAFLAHAFKRGDDGRLLYPEQCFSAPKKSGKSVFGALHLLTTVLLFGGRYGEGNACANDLEQAQGRVFEMCRRIVEASPMLKREAKVTADKITFPAFGATITALASHYESAAGGHPVISCFDELWGYTSERSRRLWDELVPVPTRQVSCRLVTTHAGFEGESLLLHDLYERGMALPEIGEDLHAGDGLLLYWSHKPIAPWQTEKWIAEMRRSLRQNQFARMVENRWVSTDSAFIDMGAWDACVDLDLRPLLANRSMPVWIGCDASVKRDSTALVAVAYDAANQRVRLINHKIFQPTAAAPIDFEAQIEQTLREWHAAYLVKSITFDPYQMVAVAQRLARDRLPMQELPQTSGNLVAFGSNLFELIQGRNLTVYPSEQIRLAISRAVAIESSRGWKISKEKTSHRIDVVVALAMAALACVQAQRKPPAPKYSNYLVPGTMAGTNERDVMGWNATAQRWEKINRNSEPPLRLVRDSHGRLVLRREPAEAPPPVQPRQPDSDVERYVRGGNFDASDFARRFTQRQGDLK